MTATRPGAIQLAAWRAFLEAHSRVIEQLSRQLQNEEDLPLSWYDVLVHLSEADGHRLRMQELAGAILLSKSGLTRLIDRMETAELVCRSACDSDGRGTYAELTAKGLTTLKRTAPTHLRGVDQYFLQFMDDADAAAVERVMRRIAEAADA